MLGVTKKDRGGSSPSDESPPVAHRRPGPREKPCCSFLAPWRRQIAQEPNDAERGDACAVRLQVPSLADQAGSVLAPTDVSHAQR
jgi:hypothetical protein